MDRIQMMDSSPLHPLLVRMLLPLERRNELRLDSEWTHSRIFLGEREAELARYLPRPVEVERITSLAYCKSISWIPWDGTSERAGDHFDSPSYRLPSYGITSNGVPGESPFILSYGNNIDRPGLPSLISKNAWESEKRWEMIAMSEVQSSFQEMPSRLHFLPFLARVEGMGCHWNECIVGPVPLVIGPGIGISTGWGRVVVGSASAERDAL
ncbi:hypothetical protein Sjap_026695 [Stephania japonica]|uniref:Uncharacterized protein n=1 Tax=Stephania japonica TaxID=461633 RepID=A0AAP0DY08_9MAGN